MAHNILSSTYQPVVVQDDEYRVTASVGISLYPKDGEDGQTLMKNADTAMYYAKGKGKNNHQFYSKDIQLQSAGRLEIERELRFALERDEFSLHYQAKVDVKTGKIIGVEAPAALAKPGSRVSRSNTIHFLLPKRRASSFRSANGY